MEGSIRTSVTPGTNRPGGAERLPPILAPYFTAATMCRACSTVSTCGTTILAPASIAYAIVSCEWPGTLQKVKSVPIGKGIRRAYRTNAIVFPSLINCTSCTILKAYILSITAWNVVGLYLLGSLSQCSWMRAPNQSKRDHILIGQRPWREVGKIDPCNNQAWVGFDLREHRG